MKSIKFNSKLVSLILLFCFTFQQVKAQEQEIKQAGDLLLFALPAATLGVTFLEHDKEGTWDFTKSFLLNQAVTTGLKYAIDKPRPNNERYGFPSGHTSTTFQSASFIHQRYGLKYSLPAYALAGYTAFSRINAEKHDGWDVLAGAAVGIGSTLIFTTPYQQEHMELTYNNQDGSQLIGFSFKF